MTMSGRWSVEQISGGTVSLLWSKSIRISQSWAQERRLDMGRFGGIEDGWSDITKDDEMRGILEKAALKCYVWSNVVRVLVTW